MKKLILLTFTISFVALSLCHTTCVNAQSGVSINSSGNPADPSAMLDVSSTSAPYLGMLIPRMTTSNRNAIISPATGLLVFNTDCGITEYYTGTCWISMGQNLKTPDIITCSGTTDCCANESRTFSIPPLTGATAYKWTVPAGATVTSGQGTTSATVLFGNHSGDVCVTAENICEASPSRCIDMYINIMPPASGGLISGTASVSSGQSGVSYSVPAIAGATSYLWTYSGTGATISGTTTSITINFSGSATSGNLTVMGSNTCGNGSVSANYAITVNTMTTVPTAAAHTPSSTQIVWNWNTVAGATGYKYNTINDYSSAADNSTSTSYTQTGLTCNTPYTLYVWAYNSCGNSASTILTQTTGSCCTTDGTGGTITHVGGMTIHTFTSSGTFTPNCSMNVQYLVVAGGGGGGGSRGGGGGAGGLKTGTIAVTAGAITVTVGGGGAGSTLSAPALNGSNSVFGTITSTGGGRGAGDPSGGPGNNGGSGGGGASDGGKTTAGTGTVGEGNNGGNAIYGSPNYPGGGGGGAGFVGVTTSSPSDNAGNGGSGLSSSISGSPVTYAGGGGGGAMNGTTSTGGSGGGGNGNTGLTAGAYPGSAATPNTGGGGGGGGNDSGGGNGGSGIVIISYPTP